jgi:hypothetical protein
MDPEPKSQTATYMGLEGNYYYPVSCDVKELVSRDYSNLVFIHWKASGGHSKTRSYGSGAYEPKNLPIRIWKETSTALYLAMLKGLCHEIIRVWSSSNTK